MDHANIDRTKPRLMLTSRSAQWAFLVITLISVGAALFRIATAPDRVRERRNLAYMNCIGSGGVWTAVGRTEICTKPGEVALPIPRAGQRQADRPPATGR